jgi:hypothetical protein
MLNPDKVKGLAEQKGNSLPPEFLLIEFLSPSSVSLGKLTDLPTLPPP